MLSLAVPAFLSFPGRAQNPSRILDFTAGNISFIDFERIWLISALEASSQNTSRIHDFTAENMIERIWPISALGAGSQNPSKMLDFIA